MRHKIDDNMSVITFETLNQHRDPQRLQDGDPTERYSYYVEYRDTANKLRESEAQRGFFSAEHCIQDALSNIDCLDLRPEPEPEPREAPITVPYHYHICTEACGVHRCVNPACEVKGEFVSHKVAEIICPKCGRETGVQDFFERQQITIATHMPLVIERANAA
jgi:hypothetical protein